MALVLIVFLWLTFIVLTMLAAATRNRSVFMWFIWSALFGLLALIAILIMGKRERRR